MSNELKPCPFCGSTRLGTEWDGFSRRVRCYDCIATGPVSQKDRDGAVEAWNKRRADGLRNFLDAEHKKAFGESKLQAAKAYFAALIQFDKLLGKSMGIQAAPKEHDVTKQ
jgi:Lar family restriction alleviation protein